MIMAWSFFIVWEPANFRISVSRHIWPQPNPIFWGRHGRRPHLKTRAASSSHL